jgi:hypothetical protein
MGFHAMLDQTSISPLKNKKRESTFLSSAPRFPKEHYFLKGSHASHSCPSGESNM